MADVTASADVIVLGTGGVGSAAAFHLARRGARVLGIDRFPGGHDRGSSHGTTRIIRLAYFEHPDYVPLLRRAYDLWSELEGESGQRLYHEVGLVQIGDRDGEILSGVRASAATHGLPIEEMDGSDVARRFPGLRAADGMSAVFERRAGYLRVERAVLAHLAAAARAGARLLVGESVLSWTAGPSGVSVQTDRGRYEAGSLVITAGPWAGHALATLAPALTVRRTHMRWYPAAGPSAGALPAYLVETGDGVYYGVPDVDGEGLKVGEHAGGAVVPDPLEDPGNDEPGARERVDRFVQRHLPAAAPGQHRRVTCWYTMSPDGHFIVDRHPDAPGAVVLAAGLSGHGFKFATVLGEVLADLALDGGTRHPIGFLGLARPSLQQVSRH